VIENELRELLSDRAGDLPDNAGRVRDVHSRISGIRRRRTAGATLALVLVVAAGVLLTRLPGTPDALPTGAPTGPYFADDTTSHPVKGYRGGQYFAFDGDATWSVIPSAGVVVARCEHAGDLRLRNVSGSGPELRLSCRVPVGDHWEGALPLDPNQVGVLLAAAPAGGNVAVRPSSLGSWTVGLLVPLYAGSIGREQVPGALLSGFDHPAGGPLTLTIPGLVREAHGFVVVVFCVRDVRLEFRVTGRLLTTVACTDEADPVNHGVVTVLVPEETVTALGLRPLQRVVVDVRSTGRQTDQWAVVDVG